MKKTFLLLFTALLGTLSASAQFLDMVVFDNETKDVTAADGAGEDGYITVEYWMQYYYSIVNVDKAVTLEFTDESMDFTLFDYAVINLKGKMKGVTTEGDWFEGSRLNMYLDEGAEFTVNLSFYFSDGYDNHFQYIFSLPAEGGWRSLYLPTQAKVPAGCTAYYASSASGSTVTLKAINEGEVIPAYTGVILYGAGDITMQGSTDTPVDVTGNLFQGVSTVTACSANENYVLNASASTAADVVMFSNYTGTSLGANKAYLPKSAVPAGAIQFRFDDATAISTVEMESSDDVLYNMAGQRVSSDYRGIVIKNGKKMFNL